MHCITLNNDQEHSPKIMIGRTIETRIRKCENKKIIQHNNVYTILPEKMTKSIQKKYDSKNLKNEIRKSENKLMNTQHYLKQ